MSEFDEKAVADPVQTIMNKRIPALASICADASPLLLGNPGVAALIETIERDFDGLVRERQRKTLPGEDVFWWCIGMLEMFCDDFPSGSPVPDSARRDSFVISMMADLREMAPLLARREPLPGGKEVGWVDDWDDDDWDDEWMSVGERTGLEQVKER